jgi:hypothetical protein
MNLELKPELEQRLQTIAQKRSQSLSELVEEAMLSYLRTGESESSSWVKATQSLLPRIWSAADFMEWTPPDASGGGRNPAQPTPAA